MREEIQVEQWRGGAQGRLGCFGVAQLVEQRIVNPCVAGSIPAPGAITSASWRQKRVGRSCPFQLADVMVARETKRKPYPDRKRGAADGVEYRGLASEPVCCSERSPCGIDTAWRTGCCRVEPAHQNFVGDPAPTRRCKMRKPWSGLSLKRNQLTNCCGKQEQPPWKLPDWHP